MARHRHVDVAGELDEPVHEPELARSPGEIVRIDRNAVTAHSRTGPEGHEPEGLGGSRINDFPDVEAHPLAQHGQLVDQGDVHVAEDVLQQLGHLGRVWRRQFNHGAVDVAEQSCGTPGGRGRHPADQSRDVGARACRIARVDPLWNEGEVKVTPCLESAACFQCLAQRTGGRAGEGRRLKDNHLAGAHRLAYE